MVLSCTGLIKAFLPVYIENINGDVYRPTDQPTNRPTDRVNKEQSAFSNVRKKGRDLQYFKPGRQSQVTHICGKLLILKYMVMLDLTFLLVSTVQFS